MTGNPIGIFNSKLLALMLGVFFCFNTLAQEDKPAALGSADQVDNRIQFDRVVKQPIFKLSLIDPWYTFQDSLKSKIGLSFGTDYQSVFIGSNSTYGEPNASGGIFRFYSSWDLIGRKSGNTGSFVFKFEHRHKYGTIAPFNWSFLHPNGAPPGNGYIGFIQAPFNDTKFRVQNLYWRQRMFKGNAAVVVGFLDVTDFLDIYAMAIPWTQFFNLNFSTGASSISLPNDGYLGALAGGWITKKVYMIAGFGDINSDPTNVFEGFSTFFNENEYFKHVEIGMTSSKDYMLLDNVHATFWHRDASELQGTSEGWGLVLSATRYINEKWLPFLRFGYAQDGGSLLETVVSAGFGYQPQPKSHLLGLGVSWGRPSSSTWGDGLDDQFVSELFYRIQLSQKIAITPDLQFILNPALNPNDDYLFVYGIRGRIAI